MILVALAIVVVTITVATLVIRANKKYTSRNKIHFLTFGNEEYSTSCARLCNQARELGIFSSVLTVDSDLLFSQRERDFVQRNPRGFGFWFWKPRVIQRAMSRMSDGEILLYVDGGCRIGKIRNRIADVAERLKFTKDKYFAVAPFSGRESNDYVWTKSDLFDHMNIHGDLREMIANSPQLEANVIFIVVDDVSRSIVNEWLTLMDLDRSHLFDDAPSKQANHPSFREHRHDQSVLSLLLKKHDKHITIDEHIGIFKSRNFRTMPKWLRPVAEFLVQSIL